MKRFVLLIASCLLSVAPVFAQNTPGSYAPGPAPQFFTDAGAPCGGCLLYTYVAGSTTALATYSDSALTSANANPIVLDSAGRATIYLQNRVYRFDLKTSGGSLIWTRDNISSFAQLVTAAIDLKTVDGRITLQSGTCVPTADQTAKTTVYFTPCGGNRIALYDGTNWNLRTFTELSIALGTDAANTPYDLFIYDNAGTPTLERLAWTNDTTRATNLTTQDGVYVKSGAVTRRYLGTYRTTGTIGQTEDSFAKRFVWNYYNRVKRTMRVTDATDSWAYTTATMRQARASTANQLDFVVGVAEVEVQAEVIATASNTTGTANVYVSIGLDSTTTATSGTLMVAATLNATVASRSAAASVRTYPAVGRHFLAWLEYSDNAGTTNWQGDGGAPDRIQSGIHGVIEG